MYRKMCGFAVGVVLAWGMVGVEALAQKINLADNEGFNVIGAKQNYRPEYTGSLVTKDIVGNDFVEVTVNDELLTVDIDYEWRFNLSCTNAGSCKDAILIMGIGKYEGSIYRDLTIIPKKIVKPTLPSGTTFDYDGTLKTVAITPENTAYELSGHTGTNAGNYTATVSLTSKTNYCWEWSGMVCTDTEDLTFDWSINKATVAKPTAVTPRDLVYNGAPQTVTPSPSHTAYELIDGHTFTNAGTYFATAALTDKVNYQWEDGTVDDVSPLWWSISKQAIFFHGPALKTSHFTYEAGVPRTVELATPSEHYMLSGDITKTDAGTYTAILELTDPANYKWSDGTSSYIQCHWTIAADISSVLSSGREFPNAAPDNSAVVIAPVNITAFEVSAGPNPVRKSDGGINIFVSGKRVDDGTLTVYDGSGNVINKITIRDNAVIGNIGRRVVGSWDLRDAKGNHVSAGSYLLRGSVKTAGGKRERVSVVVGVW